MKARNDYHIYLLPSFGLLALIAYSTVLNSFFLSDDFAQIGKVLEGEWSVTWGVGQGTGFFRPLFIFSYIIDSKLWGTNPFGYHLTNLAIHTFNSYLVSIFSARLLRKAGYDSAFSLKASIAAGLIFLLHPSHTEAVSWISGRADLIATSLFLLALIFYDSYRQRNRSFLLASILVLFMLALLAKESALCLPFIIVAIEFSQATQERKTSDLKRRITEACLLILILLIYFLIRYAAIGTFVGVYGASQHLNFKLSLLWERLPKYFIRALLPPLPIQLSFMLVKPFKSRAFLFFAGLFVSAVSALLVYRRKSVPALMRKQQNALLLLLLALFLCALFPVITLGINVSDTPGERFVYLPSIFSSIFLAYISAALISNQKLWLASVAALLLFYSASLYRSNRRWQEAAGLSQSILNDLTGQSKSDDLLILNVPDNLRGVPVYRNGLEQALETFQSVRKIGRVEIISYHNIPSTTGNVDVRREPNGFSIHLLNQQTEFSRINDRVNCVEIVAQSRDSLTMHPGDCFTGWDVFYFQDGKMIAAPASQELVR
ncbi:MAG TPA: hypothetical protein VK619_15335 [Pyrinomonadaceae bacterium]|nr:hypothetical protein [Pyrinomonadaceae bacterium]